MLTNEKLYRLAHHAILDYVVFRGLLALLAGILLITMPGAATLAICIILAVFLLINGVMAVIKSLRIEENRNSLLVYGLVCLAAGIVILLQPWLLERLFVWIFAIWVLIAGIDQCLTAAKSKSSPVSVRILTALTGLLSVVLGLALLFNPTLGLQAIIMVIGIYFLAFGILAIIIGVTLYRANKNRQNAFMGDL
ncbi:MAG: DUF308 domain-containing protein [Victivallales bacterium]|nr:DUF308 domain-containing protein [Victivallales bacterium]